MKKIFLLLFISIAAAAFTLEIDAGFSMGNLVFPESYAAGDNSLDGTEYPWGIDFILKQQISENTTIEAGFIMDPVLRNILYTQLLFREDLYTIGAGPFFGAFNSESILLNTGISTVVQIEIPGILFFNFRTDNTIGSRMVAVGDYIQSRSNVSFGFYVPNAICTLYLDSKDYTEIVSLGEIKNSSVDYMFGVEVFAKNVPYKIDLRFGYKHLTKTFYYASTEEHTIGSVLVGIKFDMAISKAFRIYLNADSNIYAFGYNTAGLINLPTTGINSFLFQAKIGFKLDLDEISDGKTVSPDQIVQ